MCECDDCGKERADVTGRKIVPHRGNEKVRDLCPPCARNRRKMPGIRRVTRHFTTVTKVAPE